jgi:inhibitor of cysteine peptidase
MDEVVLRIYFLSLARVTALVGACLIYFSGAVFCSEAEKVSKTMLLLLEADNDRTVDIRLGETVQVRLPENATTGYRWSIDREDEEFIEVLGSEPHYPAGAVGSGGEVTFVFRGRKIGTGEVGLKYWRSWQGDSSIASRFRVRFNVHP